MRAVAVLLVALLLATVAGPARANDKRVAGAAFQRGRALYDAGQFAEALAAFKDGHDAYPLPGFLVNMGQCLRKLDRPDEAQSLFQQFLASDSSDDRTRAEVREALDEIATERARRSEATTETARPPREEPPEAKPVPASAEEARPDLRVHRVAPAPPPAAPVAAVAVAPAVAPAAESSSPKKKSKKWVWAIVAVLAAGAAASAVTVGVLESQPAPPRPGSLGLLDGRR
jgi:tetratricopeptide (TPR) repeat protein